MKQLVEGLVSVVVPVFNRKKFVDIFLNTLLNQSYCDIEILLIDDGSTDGTYEMLADYMCCHSNIFLYRRDSGLKGAQSCRNMGLRLAQGEYIVFFDSDDYVQPFCIEQRVNYLRQNPDLDFGVFPAQEFCIKIGDRNRYWGMPIKKDVLSCFLESYIPISGWTNMYKTKSLLDKYIFWDERLGARQDVDFNIQCLLSGLKFSYAKGTIVDYYFRVIINEGSISKKCANKENLNSHMYLCDKVLSDVQKKYGYTYNKQLVKFVIYYMLMADNNDVDYIKYLFKNVLSLKVVDLYVLLLYIYVWFMQTLKVPRKFSKYILFPYYLERVIYLKWYHSKRI